MTPITNVVAKEREVRIALPGRQLVGELSLPAGTATTVLFAHGSGSGRASPRNRLVARTLQQAGIGTLLIDLLTEDESQDRRKVFDIELLASRFQAAADWLGQDAETRRYRLGYFGASTGAAAVLVAAARQPEHVGAIVCRGGRPDLAHEDLPAVEAPTLLIVGGDDTDVLELNRQALAALRCTKALAVVPGATHLFPEPGALEDVARLTADWFERYLLAAIERLA